MSAEKAILEGILSTIADISDAYFQQEAWIEKKIHPYAFFEESMHQLFDDYELSEVLENYKQYKISDKQHEILNKFYKLINQYSDEKMSWEGTVDPKEILIDPSWHKIQLTAKEVLLAFNYRTKMEKENVLIRYFCNIKRLLDREQEKQVWILKEGPEDEIFEFDIEDSVLEDYKSLGITDSQYQLLIEFRDRFRKFSKERGFSQDSMDTEEWKTIIELGRELLKAKPLDGLL